MKNLLLHFLEYQQIRRIYRFNATVTKETFVEVILKLEELVDQRIESELDGHKKARLCQMDGLITRLISSIESPRTAYKDRRMESPV